MTLNQVYDLLQTNRVDKLKELLQINFDVVLIHDALKQYDPITHRITDKAYRPDKVVYKDGTNELGEATKVIDGINYVHRITIPFQRQMVLLRSMFIGDPKMKAAPVTDAEVILLDIIKKIWLDNKMPYRFMETKKRTMSELRCAWLWYNVEAPEYWDIEGITSNLQPKMKVLSHELGDMLYPLFDSNNDLIAFARGYNSVEYDEDYKERKVEHLDIYTAERIYFKRKVLSVWSDNFIDGDILFDGMFKINGVGKIPITYFTQPASEWADVQSAADRLDELMSNHADTNDYFGNPILFGSGDTLSLPQKGDAGKYVEGNTGADLKFVTWNNAPESIKMEIENLYKIVNNMSNTPDISFAEMRGIGAMSGFAINLMFLGATIKAKECEMSVFGEGVQRAYNYLKKLVSVLDRRYIKTLSFSITPEFTSALPSNQDELIDRLIKVKDAGIMSIETAIEQNPVIEDTDLEKSRIGNEVDAKAMVEQTKTQTFKMPALS